MVYGDLPHDAPEKHNKGLEGGACNRRRCQAEPALYYNHGSQKWYCADCARDISNDPVNKRDWDLRWRLKLNHEMFETREQMDKRHLDRRNSYEISKKSVNSYLIRENRRTKEASSSLKRILGKIPRRG